ncbi:MAG: hypothetical protein J7M39_14935 [Anaerolineae bacterium]|nr:hypothetical protein [Anaerolineae bacterium]
MQISRKLSVLLGIGLVVVVVAGCGGGSAVDLDMASKSDLPSEVRSAPTTVRESYQFAVANPGVLEQVPCYCGCGAMGHTSNYSCYVEGTDASGETIFDGHALGCSICVDITQDTMRLLKQGKSIADIQVYVDQRYSQYGPPTRH